MLVSVLQALRVSVGKLGIIGRVKLQLVQEIPVRRYADWFISLFNSEALDSCSIVCRCKPSVVLGDSRH
jgi:hypothetical protein